MKKFFEWLFSLFSKPTVVIPKPVDPVKPIDPVKPVTPVPSEPKVIGHIPFMGEVGPVVGVFQTALKASGFDPGTIDNVFGGKTKSALNAAQAKAGLPVSSVVDEALLKTIGLKVVAPVISGETPWMDWMKEREGWNETNNDKQLAEYWKYTTYHAKTVVGRAFAWCAMTVNAALFETGFVGNRSAAAVSFAKYGTACELRYGCIVVIEHSNGEHHVGFFVKQGKNNVILFGGNQGNALCQKEMSSSDKVIAKRWPVTA